MNISKHLALFLQVRSEELVFITCILLLHGKLLSKMSL